MLKLYNYETIFIRHIHYNTVIFYFFWISELKQLGLRAQTPWYSIPGSERVKGLAQGPGSGMLVVLQLEPKPFNQQPRAFSVWATTTPFIILSIKAKFGRHSAGPNDLYGTVPILEKCILLPKNVVYIGHYIRVMLHSLTLWIWLKWLF